MIYEFSNVDAMLDFFIDINIKDRRIFTRNYKRNLIDVICRKHVLFALIAKNLKNIDYSVLIYKYCMFIYKYCIFIY